MIWPWRRRRRDAELDEEIRSHLAMAARDHEARGESPKEAAYAARREFGNRTLVKEVTRRSWRGAQSDQLLQDLRLALRSLARSPGFVLVAVLALGLGLGLSTTMFGVLDAVLNPRTGYREPDRTFKVRAWYGPHATLTPADLFRAIRDRSRSLDAVVPYTDGVFHVQEADSNPEVGALFVPPSWFALAGVRPVLGRAFTDADSPDVVVLSQGLWRRLLGARRSLAGARVTLGARSYTVLGVMSHDASRIADAVLPMPASYELAGMWSPLVHLRPGVSVEQARAEMKALSDALTARTNSRDYPYALLLEPVRKSAEPVKALHKAMLGSALAVLLIACINLAHLMLARGISKRRELAMRLALGAGRAAAIRVMLIESGLVCAAGFGLGAASAMWASDLLVNRMPREVGWLGILQPELSWRVFALGAVAAALSAALFGVIPAVRVARSLELTEPMKDDAGTTTGTRRQRYSPLVIGEVALALVLLMGGGLLLRTVHQLRTTDYGFNAETLVQALVFPRSQDTTAYPDWPRVWASLRAVPGVLDAAYQGAGVPMGGAVTAELSQDSTRTIPMRFYGAVSPNYLRVHGLPILKGRDFEEGDVAGDGVAILSSVTAEKLYPGQNPVGRMIKLGSASFNRRGYVAPWIQIVGVARTPLSQDVVIGEVAWDPLVWVARPPGAWRQAWFLIRTASRDPKIGAAINRAIASNPDVGGAWVFPYTRARDAEIASRLFLAKVFVGMGGLGLALAALGVFGVLAYAVTQRMREFAVRIALGAQPGTLFRMVLHDGLVMLLAGTGVGAFAALAASYLLNAVLIGVNPTDALSLTVAEAVLLAVGLGAALVPARRAIRANPVDILRAV